VFLPILVQGRLWRYFVTTIDRHIQNGRYHQGNRSDDREWLRTAADQHESLDAGIGR